MSFLRASPREVNGMLRAVAERERRAFYIPAAMICATLCNLQRDPEKHPEPYTVGYFLGDENEEEISDREFIDKVLAGDSFEFDPDQVAAFRRQFEGAFKNVKAEVTIHGPRGKEERTLR